MKNDNATQPQCAAIPSEQDNGAMIGGIHPGNPEKK